MENKNISNIIVASLLWSLVPIFVAGLFETTSIIMIIFLRFLVSGIILFIIAVFLVFLNNKKAGFARLSVKVILKSTLTRNEQFFNVRYLTYFSLVGFFGIILQIIGYFFALKITSVSLTMVGFQLSIIIVAFYEHGVKLERLDIFKVLYLIILIFSISLIIFVKAQEIEATSPEEFAIGGVYIALFALCISFLNIGMVKDTTSETELKLMNKNQNYKIIRMLFKVSLMFLLGIALLIPFTLFVLIIPLEINLYLEVISFFEQFKRLWSILISWQMILLIIFSTIIPYLLMFIANVNWIPYNLTYSQWNSILNIIEPAGALLFGVIFTDEEFPLGYLIIILFLLIISILLRYINESRNKINAYILIGQEQGFLQQIQLQLLKVDGVQKVASLIGKHDIIVDIKTNSIRDVYRLINEELKNIKGIKSVDILFIQKINKYTS
ncbi:MAG: conserved membrane protein of unknown function [Promethearchaeota archaeon]|nr:MAG: conserved membrane protein of unknown function [Candidatus Lokiarchaeota archaeon]